MVFCGLCKEAREPAYHWAIHENGAGGRINKFRICDECATLLLRRMARRVMGVRAEQELPSPLILSKTGVINDIILHGDNTLEVTIDLDISKARRWVEKELSAKE